MTIDYTQSVANYEDFVSGREEFQYYTLELAAPLTKVVAIDAIEAIDENKTFRERAEFCRKLLMGNKVTLRNKDKVVAEFAVTQGMQWFSIDALNEQPYALKFIVITVYGMFLKRCAPRLHDFQS